MRVIGLENEAVIILAPPLNGTVPLFISVLTKNNRSRDHLPGDGMWNEQEQEHSGFCSPSSAFAWWFCVGLK